MVFVLGVLRQGISRGPLFTNAAAQLMTTNQSRINPAPNLFHLDQTQLFASARERVGLPKLPPNAFALFVKEQMKTVNFKQTKCSEALRTFSVKWKELPLASKQPYIAESQKLRDQHKREMNRIPADKLKQLQDSVVKQRAKRGRRSALVAYHKFCEQNDKPKRPETPLSKVMVTLHKEGVKGGKELVKKAAERFKALPAEELQKMKMTYASQLAAYKPRLEKWEQNLKKAGTHELYEALRKEAMTRLKTRQARGFMGAGRATVQRKSRVRTAGKKRRGRPVLKTRSRKKTSTRGTMTKKPQTRSKATQKT